MAIARALRAPSSFNFNVKQLLKQHRGGSGRGPLRAVRALPSLNFNVKQDLLGAGDTARLDTSHPPPKFQCCCPSAQTHLGDRHGREH